MAITLMMVRGGLGKEMSLTSMRVVSVISLRFLRLTTDSIKNRLDPKQLAKLYFPFFFKSSNELQFSPLAKLR